MKNIFNIALIIQQVFFNVLVGLDLAIIGRKIEERSSLSLLSRCRRYVSRRQGLPVSHLFD